MPDGKIHGTIVVPCSLSVNVSFNTFLLPLTSVDKDKFKEEN